MRRFVIATVAILALALPTAADAKTVHHAFTMDKANQGTCCVFKMHLAHAGRIDVVLRWSRTHNPRAHFILSLRSPTDPEGNVIMDTGPHANGCARAGDFYVCTAYLHGLAAGNYSLAIGKETPAPAAVHLRLSWPAS